MNRSYRKTILRTIKSSLSRFLAIFAIVALGVGFLAGLLSSPEDMQLSADAYCDEADMYDVRAVSTLGLTDDDLELVRSTPGVKDVLPVHDVDLVLLSEEKDAFTSRIHTLPREQDPAMNTPVLLTGRMPEQPGECLVVITKSFAAEKEWIGQVLTPEEESDGQPESLTVVGTAKSALYMSMEQEHTHVGTGTLDLLVYTVDESFDLDYYTGFYMTVEGGKEKNAFSAAYKDLIPPVTEALEALGETRAQVRYEEIVDDAQKELDDARKEYEDAKAEAEEKLSDAEKELDDARQEIDDNRQKLQDAKQEIEDGWAELKKSREDFQSQTDSAQKQIDDGRAQIASYQAQIDAGKAQIDSAQAQLDAGYQQLDESDSQLREAKFKLDQTQSQLDGIDAGKAGLFQTAASLGMPAGDRSDGAALALIAQLEAASPQAAGQFAGLKAGLEALAAQGTDSAEARLALEAGKAEYEQNAAKVAEARAELEQQQALLDRQAAPIKQQQAALDAQRAELDSSASALAEARADAAKEFADAEKKLNDAQKEYDDGLQKLEDGEKELADGWEEYRDSKADADKELADAEEKLNDAQEQIDEIEEGQWYVFTRDDNASFSSYDSNTEKIAAIAKVFPLFFFLVAALVALTSMTRMVEEERQQIGTLKALGYSSGKIAAKYLIYAALASVAGAVFGLLFGLRLFPYIIITAYNIMYDVPKALTPFNTVNSLFSSLAAILCTLIATLSACWAALRENAARLMLPKAPKAGKRVFLEYITPLWSRLKFTQKVTARNILRYKKRFFMTVIGIAGCTALLVTGFGIQDSVSHIVAYQYDDLYHYQLMVILERDKQDAGLDDVLSSGTERFMYANMDNGKMIPKGDDPKDEVTIFSTDDTESLTDFITFRRRKDHSPIELGDDYAIVTEKLAERQHLKVGDVITVKNQDEQKASFTITGICENYVRHYLYISQSKYDETFGKASKPNVALCKLPESFSAADEDDLASRLMDCKNVAGTWFTTELSESFANTIKSLNSIVLVLIISAGALAFVVLYNLTNINISEREKELATIKVLGFYDGEVSAYVYRETAILALIGTALGLFLGIFLHQFVVRTAEVDIVMFGRVVYPLSYLWSALLTAAFSVLVNLVMHRKLKKISMVESMKAPE